MLWCLFCWLGDFRGPGIEVIANVISHRSGKPIERARLEAFYCMLASGMTMCLLLFAGLILVEEFTLSLFWIIVGMSFCTYVACMLSFALEAKK
jgi:hypothetical protein